MKLEELVVVDVPSNLHCCTVVCGGAACEFVCRPRKTGMSIVYLATKGKYVPICPLALDVTVIRATTLHKLRIDSN
jgi:hypothetical protein